MKVQTSSGEAELRNAEADRTALRSGSGDICLRGFRGVELRGETGSGELRLQADTESMDIKTGSGDIELEAGSRARQVRMVAGSGEIRLNLGHVEGASIVARTGSGELRIRGQEASGRSHSFSYGSGTCRVNLTTGSGDIEVR